MVKIIGDYSAKHVYIGQSDIIAIKEGKMIKNKVSEKFQQGIKNVNSIYNNLSQTIGMTKSGWHKAVIGNNFDVIVKEASNDWEAVATNLIIEKDHKDRLVMLDTVNQGGKIYMVLTYPARKEKAQQLLQERLKNYQTGISPLIFGTEEELEIAKEHVLQQKTKLR